VTELEFLDSCCAVALILLWGLGMKYFAGKSHGVPSGKGIVLAGAAFAMALSASSAAFAQNCTFTNLGPNPVSNATLVMNAAGAASASLAGAIGNVQTAFLTQQGSAFVSAPPNPAPDQPGGGVWVRGVGGQATDKSRSAGSLTGAFLNGTPINTTTSNCFNSSGQNFAGVQVGADIARLNWSGWNVHLEPPRATLSRIRSTTMGLATTFRCHSSELTSSLPRVVSSRI
jgi:hypothetical protein